ncbi:MAG: Fur family transcriptional regulator [Anaerotignum sp.]
MTNYKTMQRKILSEFLKSNPDVPFSAKELREHLPNCNISLSAIYRNLAFLEADGVISRFTKEGSRESHFQYVNTETCRNSIHLICTICNQTFHMEPNEMKRTVKMLQKRHDFLLNNTKTIFYGTCKHCT